MPHKHAIRDTGTYFQIVPSTRKIVVPSAYKVLGTVGEHYAEQVTFNCPKDIDGHDIGGCARKYVTWKNINGDYGNDELKVVNTDDESVYFVWDISNGLTVGAGLVSFSVHFEDVDAHGRIIYRWGTSGCNECEIVDSINAVLNAYEAVYVSGDVLVFSDYNVVKEGTLDLVTDGLIPEGTKKITTNGTFDVGEVASVDVAVNPPSGTIELTENGTYHVGSFEQAKVSLDYKPHIEVSPDGTITAIAKDKTTEVKLGNAHDANFISENIKEGVTIFGVTGTNTKAIKHCTGVIGNTYSMLDVYVDGSTEIGNQAFYSYKLQKVDSFEPHEPFRVSGRIGGLVIVTSNRNYKFQLTAGCIKVREITNSSDRYLNFRVFEILKDDFYIGFDFDGNGVG